MLSFSDKLPFKKWIRRFYQLMTDMISSDKLMYLPRIEMPYVTIKRNPEDPHRIEKAYYMEGKYCLAEVEAEHNGDTTLLRIPVEQLYKRGIKSLNVLVPDQSIPQPPPLPEPDIPQPPYKKVTYPMKWRSQRDNDSDQYSRGSQECSYTAMAMVVESFGLTHLAKGIRNQLEDEIAYRMWTEYDQVANGTVKLMAKYLREEFGLAVDVDMGATVEEVKQSLDEGCLVIAHTDLTGYGHVIAVCGYDDDAYNGKGAFICCDPWGEYFPGGYRHGSSQGGDSRGKYLGDHVPYSYQLASGTFRWTHAVSHSTIKLKPETVVTLGSESQPSNPPSTSADEVPQCGLDLIKEFEGCHRMGDDGRVHAYPDPRTGSKPYTIGYGNTFDLNGQPFNPGDSITKEEAEELLKVLAKTAFWDKIKQTVPYWQDMNDNQRGALLSFAYNLGADFYGSSGFNTISRVLRNKQWDQVPEAMLLYVNPGTNVEAGLTRRRKAEGALWNRSV